MKPLPSLLIALLLLAPALAAARNGDARIAFRKFGEQQVSDRAGAARLVGRIAWQEGGENALVLELGAESECRWRIESTDESSAAWVDGQLSETGAKRPELSALAALTCPWLAIRGLPSDEGERAAGRIGTKIGLAFSTVSLTRADRRTAVVVGARPGDKERPQLWLDKETGRLLRVGAKHAGQLWEARLFDAGSIATGRRAPRRVELWKSGQRRLVAYLMSPEAEAAADAAATAGDEPIDEPD